MEFDKSRIYTAVNADELKVGSKVIIADSLEALKRYVTNDDNESITVLKDIKPEFYMSRFVVDSAAAYVLCYLVSEPEENKLKWTDLKIGDIIRSKESGVEYLVTGLDNRSKDYHIYTANTWIADNDLERNWEKVDTVLFSFSSLEEYERQVTE